MSPRELLDRYFFNVFLITFIFTFYVFNFSSHFLLFLFIFLFTHQTTSLQYNKLFFCLCLLVVVILWGIGALGHLPYEEKTNYKIKTLLWKGIRYKSFYDYICFLKLFCAFLVWWVGFFYYTLNIIPNEIMIFSWRNEMHFRNFWI